MAQEEKEATQQQPENVAETTTIPKYAYHNTSSIIEQKSSTWRQFFVVLISAVTTGGAFLLVFNAFFESFLQEAIASNLPLTVIFAVLLVMFGGSTAYTLYIVNGLMNRVNDKVMKIETYADDTIHELRRVINSDVQQTSNRTSRVITGIEEKVNDVVRNLEARVSYLQAIETYYIVNFDEQDLGYRKSLEVIERARSRIWIIGDFSPEWQPLHTTTERSAYLAAIEDVVRSHIKSNSKFEYRRVVQRDEVVIHQMARTDGEVFLQDNDMKGDEQAYNHCYRVSRLKQEAHGSKVSVSLRVSRPIPSSPSILLVDNNYMLFTIPEKARITDGPGYDLQTAGVLYFEDKRGGDVLVKYFEQIYDTLYRDALEVYAVQKPQGT